MAVYYGNIIIFSAGLVAGNVAAMVKRRTRNSLYAAAIESTSPLAPLWIGLEMIGVVAWFALIILGFMALRWYLAAGMFVGTSIVTGLLCGVLLLGVSVERLLVVGRAASTATLAASIFCWLRFLAL